MKRSFIILVLTCLVISGTAQERWSEKLARTAMTIWPDSFAPKAGNRARWSYDQGVILKGIEGIWRTTGVHTWMDYIRHSMDYYVKQDGSIYDYKPADFNIDHVNNGKLLLLLYKVTGDQKYKLGADRLYAQLRSQPRTSDGGFWHKKIYPYQMWLDGLYMGQPFYAEYAATFKIDTAFNDITRQFELVYKHTLDAKTGLLYHGWDESRQEQWADKKTGRSPNFWGRSLGWFGMALVDVLDYFPSAHPKRKLLEKMLVDFSSAVKKVRDPKTSLWYDVPDKVNVAKNYPEASASCMLTYMFAKAIRKGYLPASLKPFTRKGYDAILKTFIVTGTDGLTHLNGTVSVSGLGGKPYRDGSFEYYMSEPVITDDPKGMGAFIQCAVEMEVMDQPAMIRDNLKYQSSKKIIVDPAGKGDFNTIQGALNSLPDSSTTFRTIFIRRGVYREKIYIEKSHVVLEGEDRQGTIIEQAIARDHWRCGHTDDWGVATMNVGANDLTLKNLTITNSYGRDHTGPELVYCAADTSAGKTKTINANSHQMAVRTMNATRMKAVNCHFIAYGGDTVSPWDVDNGMWYFRDCIMEGGVDFYCPRGWAWAENCEFIAKSGTAAIWHDGSRVEDSKTILKNCRFSGYDGFLLGRYHRDAQFYLLGCRFAENMRDSAIYLVPTDNKIRWGKRIYYSNCHRESGKDFTWYANNLPAGIKEGDITPDWVFKNKWQPENE